MTLYRKILVPTDGSENTKAAVSYALGLAKLAGAEITALCVIDIGSYASTPENAVSDVDSVLKKTCEDAVRYVVDLGESIGVAVRPKVINGSPARDIIEASKDFDLIVMGTIGRTGLSHLLLGSVAEKTVRYAECPVLVVRGATPEANR